MTDPVALAHAVLADTRLLASLTDDDTLAICRALVVAEARSQISDELAAAARALIEAEARYLLTKGADGYAPLKVGLAREQAALTFKRIFEEEFPHG